MLTDQGQTHNLESLKTLECLPLRVTPPACALSVVRRTASALIGSSPLVITNEPTSALGAWIQATILEYRFIGTRNNRTTLLMVSDDEQLVGQLDRVLLLSDIATTDRALFILRFAFGSLMVWALTVTTTALVIALLVAIFGYGNAWQRDCDEPH